MFDLAQFNLVNGVMAEDGSSVNGFEVMIMTSAEITQKIINEFRKRYWPPAEPNDVVESIINDLRINEDLLLDTDVDYLNKKLAEIAKERF